MLRFVLNLILTQKFWLLMKSIKALVLAVFCSVFIGICSMAFAGNANQEAEKLLNVLGMETALEMSMSQMLDIQLQQNPSLTPYKNVMMTFFQKHMSYQSLKPDMLRIYAETFTAEELKEINGFYSTDVGKKTIEKMPQLMAQGAKIGATRVQENIGELQQMIQAEAARLQAAEQ